LRLTDSEFKSLAGVVASGLELQLSGSLLQAQELPGTP
jgi:hypothetical protein